MCAFSSLIFFFILCRSDWSDEDVPSQEIGPVAHITFRNPIYEFSSVNPYSKNYFAEIEQVAFAPAHMVCLSIVIVNVFTILTISSARWKVSNHRKTPFPNLVSFLILVGLRHRQDLGY
jgi:hypothetical protein